LEILVVLAIVIIIFGVGKLPQVGGALRKNITEFRRASSDEDEESKLVEELPRLPRPSTNAFCTQCGVAAAPGVRFCTSCGHSLALT